jgi:mannose-6-phosphate isomerase-like protein (cupin superfamily)
MKFMMTRKTKYIAIALTLAVAIWGASFFGSMSLSQSQPGTTPKPQVADLKSQIVDLQSLLDKGLENGDRDLKYSTLAQTSTGEAELMSLMGFPRHYHEHENHFFYILKGQAELQIGSLKTKIKQGDFVVIPAGKKNEHELKTIGDQPLQLLAFRTPPEQ